MINEQQAKELLTSYQNDTINEEDRIRLEAWYVYYARNSSFSLTEAEIKENIAHLANKLPVTKVRLWPRFAAAAAILLVIAGGIFYTNEFKEHNTSTSLLKIDKLVQPGGNKAYLTLASGKKILLDGAANGEITNEAGVVVRKTSDGQLLYTVSSNGAKEVSGFNKIETPRGGMYQVILPDSSKVWLNAMSSLRYPLQFARHERLVELVGEGYFEIAHNEARPFKVKSEGQIVEVLGTHFNVNAYGDQGSIRTSLLEGSVIVHSGNISEKIVPGQLVVAKASELKVIKTDVNLAVAWTRGKFSFEGLKISEVMKMIGRWYDVEVIYEGEMPSDKFEASVSRFDKISTVLTLLERTGRVRFRTENRKIFVSR